MNWLAPDGRRYTVTLYREPFDPYATIAFQSGDGWIGVASTVAGIDLREIMVHELVSLFERARAIP